MQTPMQKRMAAVETRLETLEAQIVSVKKATMAKLTDNPPTIEHQYAITQILSAAERLAKLRVTSSDPVESEASGEILEWLRAMKP